MTEETHAQIVRLREDHGLTYDQIASRLDISVAKVRKALDPGFHGTQSIRDGIQRIERRNGSVVYFTTAQAPGSRRRTSLGPYSSHDEADEARRAWKAKRLGVTAGTPRKAQPDLSDVYANVRLALRNLDAARVPMSQAHGIFAALHEAEDLLNQALRDDHAGRFRRPIRSLTGTLHG